MLDRWFAFFKWETEWGGWLLLWASLSLFVWFGTPESGTQAAWATPQVRGLLGTLLSLAIALVGRSLYRYAARRVCWVSAFGAWVLEWASWCFWLLTPTLVLALVTMAVRGLTGEIFLSTLTFLLGLLWGCLTTLYIVILALADLPRLFHALSRRKVEPVP